MGMNYTFLTIIFIVVTLIYNFFIPKFNDETVERIKSKNNSWIIGDFILAIFVFLIVTVLFTLVFRNYLISTDCLNACLSTSQISCNCTVSNSLFAALVLLLQILNIVAFYQAFAYAYSYFAMIREFIVKVVMAIVAFIVILIAEIIISSLGLQALRFPKNEQWLNFLFTLVRYGSLIIYPLVVLFAVLKRYLFERTDEDDEYKPAKIIKKKEEKVIEEVEIIEDLEDDDELIEEEDYYYDDNEESNYYY